MLDVVEKKASMANGVYMDFGTAIHGAAQRYKTRKDPISVKEACEFFEKTFRDLVDKNKDKYSERDKKSDYEDFILSGKKIIEHLDRCDELRNAEPLYNEYRIECPIERTDGTVINFKGFIDLVVKTKDKRGNSILYVIDYKTCSFGWNREKRQDSNLHSQLFLYKYFLCKKFNIEQKNVRTAFVLLKRKPPKDCDAIEFFPVSAGPVVVQRALDNINSDVTDIFDKIKSGGFVKNRKLCKSKYGDVCPYAGTELCPEKD